MSVFQEIMLLLDCASLQLDVSYFVHAGETETECHTRNAFSSNYALDQK